MAQEASEKPKGQCGAPEGKRNGNYRHGRYSRSERAERLREMNERYWARRAQMPRAVVGLEVLTLRIAAVQ